MNFYGEELRVICDTAERCAREERARTEYLLELQNVSLRFHGIKALDGIDLSVRSGELFSIIGPNGAGKTTLLSILAGILKPDGGEVRVAAGAVGWVPQQAALYRRLTAEENLRLFARLEGHEDPDATVAEMLELTGLEDRRHDQVARLSGGNQQRINIAIGLLSDPAVLLLDEPSTGLDPRQRSRLWEFVLGLAGRGTTVIFSTHNIAEAERYAERILVLADGQGLFDGSIEAFHAAAPTAAGEAAAGDFESAFVRFLAEHGH
jgi:ABC-2 type transport system ATP-binding protein